MNKIEEILNKRIKMLKPHLKIHKNTLKLNLFELNFCSSFFNASHDQSPEFDKGDRLSR